MCLRAMLSELALCAQPQTETRHAQIQSLITVVRHSSSNYCNYSLRHISGKPVSYRTGFCWWSNSSYFVTDSSDYTRHFFQNPPRYSRQHKFNQNRLNRNGTPFFSFFFYPERTHLIFMCEHRRYIAYTIILLANLFTFLFFWGGGGGGGGGF